MQPDVMSFSIAKSACEKGMHWEAALGLLQGMPSRSLHPDLFSFDAALSSCEKNVW